MDLEKDYTHEIIKLAPDYEGEAIAVLTSCRQNTGKRKSVLYLHGFIDYFYHPHVGEAFLRQNYDFHALDLRKYGRALLPHQHPNYCKSLNEYFEEISIAIKKIKTSNEPLYILGHSTGGLIACSYLNDGNERHLVDGLILNSPFFDINLPKFQKVLSVYSAKVISKFSDFGKVNGVLSPAYPKSLHKDYYGEWDFNLNWKPIHGFPTYFKWLVAIVDAQKNLFNSKIEQPILLMHSSSSLRLSKYDERAKRNDIVLNIEDMKRVGPFIGDNIEFVSIKNALHDIFLSQKLLRNLGFLKMFDWLDKTEKRIQTKIN